MGQQVSCGSCKHHFEEEEIETPMASEESQIEQASTRIIGPLGQTRLTKQQVDVPTEISRLYNSTKSDILRIQVSQNQNQNLDTSIHALTIKDFKIPLLVTQALIKLGQYVIDPELIKLFKDCPFVGTTSVNKEGEFYLGQQSHGIRTGFGKILYFDNSYYEGFWFNNERQFNGRFVDKDGDCYIGEWFANQMHGEGKFIHRDSTVYDTQFGVKTQFERDQMYYEIPLTNRKAKDPTHEYEDGRLYYGNYVEDKKNGLGLFIWPDLTEYFGHYKDDKQDGFGIMNYQDGRKYEGQFANGKMHGLGILTWPNRQMFMGLYENDVKEGYGMFIWPNGQKYRGLFARGIMNGTGRMVDPHGRAHEANWVDGKRVELVKTCQNSIAVSQSNEPELMNIFSQSQRQDIGETKQQNTQENQLEKETQLKTMVITALTVHKSDSNGAQKVGLQQQIQTKPPQSQIKQSNIKQIKEQEITPNPTKQSSQIKQTNNQLMQEKMPQNQSQSSSQIQQIKQEVNKQGINKQEQKVLPIETPPNRSKQPSQTQQDNNQQQDDFQQQPSQIQQDNDQQQDDFQLEQLLVPQNQGKPPSQNQLYNQQLEMSEITHQRSKPYLKRQSSNKLLFEEEVEKDSFEQFMIPSVDKGEEDDLVESFQLIDFDKEEDKIYEENPESKILFLSNVSSNRPSGKRADFDFKVKEESKD